MGPTRTVTNRRQALRTALAGAATLALPALASSRRALPALTEGPFYPPGATLARGLDWDADLTVVVQRNGVSAARAAGEHLDLFGTLADDAGRVIDGAVIEIWQCDVFGSYRHPSGAGERVDEAFQGFGSSRSDAQGAWRFRTIRPVPYPGRAPHIHVKLRHPAFGEVTSQLFVAGDAGNARDFLYRRLDADERAQVDLILQRAPAGAAVMWLAQRPLVVG